MKAGLETQVSQQSPAPSLDDNKVTLTRGGVDKMRTQSPGGEREGHLAWGGDQEKVMGEDTCSESTARGNRSAEGARTGRELDRISYKFSRKLEKTLGFVNSERMTS